MGARFYEYTDQDYIKRLEIEADPITINSDSYMTLSLPTNKELTTNAVIGRTMLDRYPERVIFLKNTGAEPLTYQVEFSVEQSPDNGTPAHWAVAQDKKDIALPAGEQRVETSSRAPYSAMRIRVKRGNPGQNSTIIPIVSLSKWSS